MTYKCGCGFEASDKRGIVAHMLTWHNSGFQEGDPELVALSNEMALHPQVKGFRDFVRGGG